MADGLRSRTAVPQPRSRRSTSRRPTDCLGLGPLALASCVLLALTISAGAANADSDDRLHTYSSRHYTIHTDLDREQVRLFAVHMDAVFRAFERRFASFQARSRQAMPLYLFETESAYHAFLATQQIDATNSSGMFFTSTRGRGLAVYVEGQPRSKVFATLQHEGFHQFAHDYLGSNLPIWLNEGLAQYFEAGIIVGHELRTGMTDSFGLEAVQAAVREGRVIAFDELLADTTTAWNRRLSSDPQRARLAYAQAWSMAYFLIHAEDGRYRPRLDEYLRRLSDAAGIHEAFSLVFGDDLTAFERVWRRYVLELRPDPVNTATDRMTFLAQSMLFLAANEYPLPANLDELQTTLGRLQYHATWRMNGMERQYTGRDQGMYTYQLPTGASARFRLLEPARSDLPPRITAPGLVPEPTVIWTRGTDGRLVSDIIYR